MRTRRILNFLYIVFLSPICLVLIYCVVWSCDHVKNSREQMLGDSILVHLKDSSRLRGLVEEVEDLPDISRKIVLLNLSESCRLSSVASHDQWVAVQKLIELYRKTIKVTSGMEKLDLQLGLLELYKNGCIYDGKVSGWDVIMELAGNKQLTGEKLARYQIMTSTKLNLEESLTLPEGSLTLLGEAINYYSQSDDKCSYIGALKMYTTKCMRAGDYDRALENSKRAYEVARGTDWEDGCGRLIGIVYKEMGRYSEALDYWKRYGGESTVLLNLYNRLDSTEKVRNVAKKLQESGTLSSRGMQFVEELAISYDLEGRRDSAAIIRTRYIKEMDAGRYPMMKFVAGATSMYRHQAKYLFDKGDRQNAVLLLQRIERMNMNPGVQLFFQEQLDGLVDLFTLYYRVGRFEDGKRVWLLYDSLRGEKEKLALKERFRLTAYKHAEKELMTRITEQRHDMIYMRMIITWVITCGVILLISAILLWYLYRMKQRHVAELYARLSDLNALREQVDELPLRENLSVEQRLFKNIEDLMKVDFLFQNKKLTINDVAQAVDSNRTYISSCINQFTGLNFSQWVNRYRIEYVLTHIHEMDVNVLASRAGFTSLATFYRCFKLCVQMTPKEYLEKHRRMDPRS